MPNVLKNKKGVHSNIQEVLTLVIDQGTFATRAFILDENGNVKISAFQKVHLQRHGSEVVEQDAEEILKSMQRVISEVLDDNAVRRAGVAQAGLATQRSSIVTWDKRNGKPLGPLLSWQDRRTADWLKHFIPYAVNYIGQEHLKNKTELHIYGHPEKLHPNLYKNLTNLCQHVYLHKEDELQIPTST